MNLRRSAWSALWLLASCQANPGRKAAVVDGSQASAAAADAGIRTDMTAGPALAEPPRSGSAGVSESGRAPDKRHDTPTAGVAVSQAGSHSDGVDAGSEPTQPDSSPTIELGTTSVLAPLVGPMATPAPGQENIGSYGTDLGRSTAHKGSLRLLFGDTWRSADTTAIDPDNDDIQGDISLRDFPDGASVEVYIAAHPAKAGQPGWQAAAPPVTLLTRDGKVAPLLVARDGQPRAMSLGRTPVAVWSDGGDGLFAIMNRIQPLACVREEPRCPSDFVCDTGLGGGLGVQQEGAMPCVIGSDAGCAAIPGGGYCQDRTSSTYDASNPSARKLSVVYTEELGNEDLTQPGRYLTTAWNTNKFINPCARTVADFDPSRERGAGNVYTTANGMGSREKVFLWGRPWFSSARGRDARLYFQYFDLPKYSATGQFDLKPRYFTGVTNGVPQFSDREVDAKPLELAGPASDRTQEVFDEPGELSISWLAPLRKWVMLYGAHYTPLALLAMQGGGANDVVHDPEGGIHIRFADEPWGPWSEPQYIARTHTQADEIVPLTNAPKNIVARPDCNDAECALREPGLAASDRGGLYAAHIIEPWTTERDDGLDLYWVVSTWNPYQVVLLKTHLITRH